MRRMILVSPILLILVVAGGCGQSQESILATRAVATVRAPTAASTPPPAVATEADAIRIARTVVSPYIATWQDVIAKRDNGVWRVVFRNYDPLPKGATPNEDYWRVPLSVFIDAATGIVLRQEYI
jgi:hypothetical protein